MPVTRDVIWQKETWLARGNHDEEHHARNEFIIYCDIKTNYILARRSRTADLRITETRHYSPPLYQLSYREYMK